MSLEKRNRKTIVIATILMMTLSFAAFFLGDKAEQSLTGKATSIVYINPLPPENCTLDLKQGWNMVSFHCEFGNKRINQSLVDQNNKRLNYVSVFEYRAEDPSDKWKSYNPYLPNWTVQELQTLTREPGYWVYMNTSGTYTSTGYKFNTVTIPLKQGWNLIGYPTSTEINITDGLASLEGNYTLVESYQPNGASQAWFIYIAGEGGNLTNLEPKRAYWINVTNTTTWVVTW